RGGPSRLEWASSTRRGERGRAMTVALLVSLHDSQDERTVPFESKPSSFDEGWNAYDPLHRAKRLLGDFGPPWSRRRTGAPHVRVSTNHRVRVALCPATVQDRPTTAPCLAHAGGFAEP